MRALRGCGDFWKAVGDTIDITRMRTSASCVLLTAIPLHPAEGSAHGRCEMVWLCAFCFDKGQKNGRCCAYVIECQCFRAQKDFIKVFLIFQLKRVIFPHKSIVPQ